MSLKIEGLAEVIKVLEELPIKIAKNVLRGATFAGAKYLTDALRARAPVKTGYLRDTLKAVRGKGVDADGVAWGNVHGQFYGRFQEHGTSKMPARPWVRPVLDAERDNIIKAVAEAMAPALAKVVQRAAKKSRRG